jgi:NADH:ubiquinone oxidoreductase subunit F (NADH-binding)/NADH:ubiquinone oxidoreductase subunit E
VNLIQELLALQESRGHLRDEDLADLGRRLRVPLAEIEAVTSYYPRLRRRPRSGRHRLAVCRDLSCKLRGGDAALETLEATSIRRGDVEFERRSCLGRCDSAPACSLDGEPMTTARARHALDPSAPEPADPAPGAASPARRIDPYPDPSERYGVLRESLAAGRSTELCERLEGSGLRGMGGAGFPTGRKWALVAGEQATPKYVICNADESEPGSFKDRAILAELPHLVIEGMALAGLAIGASRGWVFLRHEYGREGEILRDALDAAREAGFLGRGILGSRFDFEVEIFVSPGGYILGEETALLEALEGRRGEPRVKPPFPGQVGLHGQPTLINNVETLAQTPYVLRNGSVDFKFFSVSGDVERPSVLELPVGGSLQDLIDSCGGMREGRPLLAALPGGASTAFLSAHSTDIPMDWDSLSAAGSALGSGGVVVVGEGADLLELAANLTAFFRNESCGKCVPCRLGTRKAVTLIERDAAGDRALLRELHETLVETSLCGLGQVALNPLMSVFESFSSELPEPGRRDRR